MNPAQPLASQQLHAYSNIPMRLLSWYTFPKF